MAVSSVAGAAHHEGGRASLLAGVLGAVAATAWAMACGGLPKTTIGFSLDVAAARKAGRIPDGMTDTEAIAGTLAAALGRVRDLGFGAAVVVQRSEQDFDVVLPGLYDEEVPLRVVAELDDSRFADLKFRIEVLPEYRPDDRPKRVAVWNGARGQGPALPATKDGFDEFKRAEVSRWREALAKGIAYHPLDGRYRVVPRERPGSGPDTLPETDADFALVEEPESPAERFGGEILERPRRTVDERGLQAVGYDIRAEYRKAFGDWTEANVGLPVAIILNDRLHSAPTIRNRLDTSVLITLGRRGKAEVAGEQQRLVDALLGGSRRGLPVPVRPRRPGAEGAPGR